MTGQGDFGIPLVCRECASVLIICLNEASLGIPAQLDGDDRMHIVKDFE